ncbi:hypothetical protein ACM42_08500 [Bradyrhizobium sp. CCBAU 25338]|nr:hypothetical protein [Bradyrhizobium sp. CCBAU 25338]
MRSRVRVQEPLQTTVESPEFSTIDRSVPEELGGKLIPLVLLVTLAYTGSSKLNGTPGELCTGSGAA